MKRHLFKSRKIFSMLEPAYLANPSYEMMRHIALQMFAEGYKVGREHAERELEERVDIAENAMLTDKAFNQFWEVYDKKVGKETALKVWRRLPKRDKNEILSFIPAYVKATPNKQYRPNPTTFLRQRRWKDEIIPTEYEDREYARRKRTGEADELAAQLAYLNLDK